MGQGIDATQAAIDSECSLEDQVEYEFVDCLVSQAGAVIMGTKPAALFQFHPCRDLLGGTRRIPAHVMTLTQELVTLYEGLLPQHGMSLSCLAVLDDRVVLLAWRDGLVSRILEDGGRLDFLAQLDHDTKSAESLVNSVSRRLVGYYSSLTSRRSGDCRGRRVEFPHEVGILLGYPLEDVRGFMGSGGRNPLFRSQWKVYGCPEESRRVEGLFRWGTRRCRRVIGSGRSLGDALDEGTRNQVMTPVWA